MPADYAEVAVCSTFKDPSSPPYDNYGAYATTTLVSNSILHNGGKQSNGVIFTGGSSMGGSTAHLLQNNFSYNKNIYSAPTSCHYNYGGITANDSNYKFSEMNNYTGNRVKMNIIENKMDAINNLNRTGICPSPGTTTNTSLQPKTTITTNSTSTSSMPPPTPAFGTIKRNRLTKLVPSSTSLLSSPSSQHYTSDKINIGGSGGGGNMDNGGKTIEQPLFVKSKYDGSWTSVQHTNAAYQPPPPPITSGLNGCGTTTMSFGGSNFNVGGNGGGGNNGTTSSQSSINHLYQKHQQQHQNSHHHLQQHQQQQQNNSTVSPSNYQTSRSDNYNYSTDLSKNNTNSSINYLTSFGKTDKV